ncbi:MARCO protein, partial [Onychorhynchus coronatus]|nr:MARCO protein [Onychorhynchus coronatus]
MRIIDRYGEDQNSSDMNSLSISDKIGFASAATTTFQISEPRGQRKPSTCCARTAFGIYLLLLTAGQGLLLYKVFKMEREILKFQEQNTSYTEEILKSSFANSLISERSSAEKHMEQEENWRRSLEEEITIIKSSNANLMMMVSNITLVAGMAPFLQANSTVERPGSSVPLAKLGQKPGLHGPQGEKGSKGAPGPAGSSGVPGVKGEKGQMGLPGVQGQKGDTGKKGDTGSHGPMGPQGQQGVPGLPGFNGTTGKPGPPGQKGEAGVPGLPGTVGNPGPEGRPGQKGEKGNQGPKGSPALQMPCSTFLHQYILFLGIYKGNYFFALHPGMQGEPGQKGSKGDSGTQGPKGEPGPKGAKGDQGLSGKTVCQGGCGADVDLNHIRLVGGSWRGRVEIFYQGTWGTICDDHWTMQEAAVVCRMLGFRQAVSAFTAGGGTGTIWLDEVNCGGSESSIFSCAKNNWGSHNCVHDEDAGVECS